MAYIDFIPAIHQSTKRNYVERMSEGKAKVSEISKKFGFDYWDGDRSTGYGGYHYDGRWRPVAEAMVEHYGLTADSSILDVGCGKGFLLFEFTQVLPGITVSGIDISSYAIENAKPEIKEFVEVCDAKSLPFETDQFDFVFSLNTLHNMQIHHMFSALEEIERVSKKDKYLVVESYRTEEEMVNLMCWQFTCEEFQRPEEWKWIFDKAGYTGDYGLIYFE